MGDLDDGMNVGSSTHTATGESDAKPRIKSPVSFKMNRRPSKGSSPKKSKSCASNAAN